MNSINILSNRVIGTPPLTPRGQSYADLSKAANNSKSQSRRASRENVGDLLNGTEAAREPELAPTLEEDAEHDAEVDDDDGSSATSGVDEKTALLAEQQKSLEDAPEGALSSSERTGWVAAVLAALRWVASTIAAPGVYLVSLFRDENGKLAPLDAIYNFIRMPVKRRRLRELESESESDSVSKKRNSRRRQSRSNLADEKDLRSKSSSADEDTKPKRRSIRLKVHNDEALKSKQRKRMSIGELMDEPTPADLLKSPSSPPSSLRLTRYPRSLAPPRPLIPPRQPSYNDKDSPRSGKKTLILDLDETLIHSMAKGGRMSSGHMVEVRLTTGIGGALLGPQHPILYYVHKRPHCDDFLRRVCKWYDLVVFTASVQEYADPVIDWLEMTQKFFSRRYYRQDCTHRNGVYIKDLSRVEPDLGKVLIIDNSPMSYIFHEDNAVPIEGWINDPTDNHLLHLVPLLEALQYATDVRAFLALRLGETSQ